MSTFSVADIDAAEVVFETIGDAGSYSDATLVAPVDCLMILDRGVQPNTAYPSIVEPIDTLSFLLSEVQPRIGGRATLDEKTYWLVELLSSDGVESTWQVRQS